jgi:hypothetical protein
MKIQTHQNHLCRAARFFIAPVAAMIFVCQLSAQTAVQPVDNRFLFIFDTSAAMKKREPAVEQALVNLLATSLRGELHAGDSVGVWTFDRDLRTGQFPLIRWDPGSAEAIADSLKDFLRKNRYANETSLAALQPYLGGVVKNSQRLTVLIFCDGQSEINWTPYDNAINKLLGERQAERKQSKQPFVLLLRSQLGEYVGCTVGLPPELVDFPEFPPLPAPAIKPLPAPVKVPPTAPAKMLPPLIIIGRTVGINLPPPEPPPAPKKIPAVSNLVASVTTNLPPETKPPPPTIPPEPTNTPTVEIKPLPPVPVNLPPTNTPTNSPPAPPTNAVVEPVIPQTNVIVAAAAPTNVIVPPGENSDNGSKKLWFIGGGLLLLAVALVAFLLLRPRRAERTSLITSSMNRGPRPPHEN